MNDLVEFLNARYHEELAEAGKLPEADDHAVDQWVIKFEETGDWDSYSYLRISKARVLAEVEAKRKLLDEHQDVNDGSCGTCVDGRWGYPTHGGSSPQQWPCTTVRILALPYAEHPDHREEWRP